MSRAAAFVLAALLVSSGALEQPAPARADSAPGATGSEGRAQARMTDTPVRGERAAGRREGASPRRGRLVKEEDQVAGGTHWRVKTDAGAVHVWVPPGYDRETAGTVVYVHGYYTDADGAWRGHSLARQFRASKQNAVFIVPDAPSGNDQDVKWPALADLRKAISRANIRLPNGPTIVMGHSGAFRTVMKWVDHKLVAQVILLDALYGGERAFDDFIGTGKRAKHHKLIVIGSDTAEESRSFIRRYPFAVARDAMPRSTDGFTKREKRAKLLYVRSQFGHMAIVTSGKVIPLLLRLTPLAAIGAPSPAAEPAPAEPAPSLPFSSLFGKS
ncbi:MAG: hypothetical protein R3B48_24730 [Kofleriaceae bacterium]